MKGVRQPYDRLGRTYRNPAKEVDVHEMLKRELLRQGVNDNSTAPSPALDSSVSVDPGASKQISVSSQQSSQSQAQSFVDTYLYFDSLSKNQTSNLANGQVYFSITNINNLNPVSNCVAITIGDFYFPMMRNATGSPEYFYYMKMFMSILTLPTTQAIQAQNGITFNYEFDIATLGSAAAFLTPVAPTIYLSAPQTSLTDFQLQFFAPSMNVSGFTPINIPNDTLTVIAVSGTTPATFNIVNDTIYHLQMPIPAAFPVAPSNPAEIAVYFNSFSSGVQALDIAMASTAGYFVTNFTSSTQFQIQGLDFATLGANTTATMIIPKNRIAFTARFTCTSATNTNYLVGVHV